MSINDINSLSHTKWNCKYHIVFAPKYRRKVFYREKRAEVGKILRQLCEWKGVKIIEAEVCPDHIHMLVEIPPKYSVSGFMGYLKGKSSTMLSPAYPIENWSDAAHAAPLHLKLNISYIGAFLCCPYNLGQSSLQAVRDLILL